MTTAVPSPKNALSAPRARARASSTAIPTVATATEAQKGGGAHPHQNGKSKGDRRQKKRACQKSPRRGAGHRLSDGGGHEIHGSSRRAQEDRPKHELRSGALAIRDLGVVLNQQDERCTEGRNHAREHQPRVERASREGTEGRVNESPDARCRDGGEVRVHDPHGSPQPSPHADEGHPKVDGDGYRHGADRRREALPPKVPGGEPMGSKAL